MCDSIAPAHPEPALPAAARLSDSTDTAAAADDEQMMSWTKFR